MTTSPLAAAAYGLLQGLTEFLPVSSSGHLVLLTWITGWRDPGIAFDVWLHVGTLAAVVASFARDFRGMAIAALATAGGGRGAVSMFERRLLGWILVASLPAFSVGYCFEHVIVETFRNAEVVATTLIGFGVLLGVVDWWNPGEDRLEEFSWKRALAVGFCQAIALVPGVSRAGITITAGRALGLGRADAARFSFLLGAPAIAGAAVYQAGALWGLGIGWAEVVGVATAAVSGGLAIGALLRWVAHGTYAPFVFYRIALGIAVWAVA